MEIGERIKLKRLELGMTQQELAEKIGYHAKTAISKIESGERELRQSKIRPIAEALDTTVEYIMDWEEAEPQLDDLDKKIMEAYQSLPDNKKLALYDFLKTITE